MRDMWENVIEREERNVENKNFELQSWKGLAILQSNLGRVLKDSPLLRASYWPS